MSRNSLLFEVDGPNGADQRVFISPQVIQNSFEWLTSKDKSLLNVSASSADGSIRFNATLNSVFVVFPTTGDASNSTCIYVNKFQSGYIKMTGDEPMNLDLAGWSLGITCPVVEETVSETPKLKYTSQQLNLPPETVLKRVFANTLKSRWADLNSDYTRFVDSAGNRLTWKEWQKQNQDGAPILIQVLQAWATAYCTSDLTTLSLYVHSKNPSPPSAGTINCDSLKFKGITFVNIDAPVPLPDIGTAFGISKNVAIDRIALPLLKPINRAVELFNQKLAMDPVVWGAATWDFDIGSNPKRNADDAYYNWTANDQGTAFTWASPDKQTLFAEKNDYTNADAHGLSHTSVDPRGTNTGCSWTIGKSQVNFVANHRSSWNGGLNWSKNVHPWPYWMNTSNAITAQLTSSVKFGSIDPVTGMLVVSVNETGATGESKRSEMVKDIAEHQLAVIRDAFFNSIRKILTQLSDPSKISFQAATSFVFPLQGSLSLSDTTSNVCLNNTGGLVSGLSSKLLEIGQRIDVPGFWHTEIKTPVPDPDEPGHVSIAVTVYWPGPETPAHHWVAEK